MNKFSTAFARALFRLALIALLPIAFQPENTFAQQRDVPRLGGSEITLAASTTEPFAAVKRAERAGQVVSLDFINTPLNPQADGSIQVALVGQTLLARVQAQDMLLPSAFDVPRYALWVYIPNYQIKMYVGDLPIFATRAGGSVIRGNSDTAYRFTNLPPNSIFGGLILTAEPVRYEPIVTEALRPVLVALVPEVDPKNVGPALTLYGGPMPSFVLERRDDTRR